MKNRYTAKIFVVMLGVMHAASNIVLAKDLQLDSPVKADPASAVVGVVGSGMTSNSVRYAMASLWDQQIYPVLLDVRKPEELEKHLANVNGVIIAGNSLDINPADYKEQQEDERTKNEDEVAKTDWDKARDDYEYALIQKVAEKKIPFLGICSGAQRLNVAMGGTLNEHVDDQLFWNEGPHQPVLGIKTIEGSRVAAIAVDDRFMDNSIHHQHIEQVADGFRVAARDETTPSVIEAIEPDPQGPYADHPMLIGVQWHPEYGASEASNRLIRQVAANAREHAERHPVAIGQAKQIDASTPAYRHMIELGRDAMREQYGYGFKQQLFDAIEGLAR